VKELLWLKMRYGRPYVLVRWADRDASGDTWEPLDNLTNCAKAIAAFERATGRVLPRPAPSQPAAHSPHRFHRGRHPPPETWARR
jgi:hypothetical protein